MKTFVLSFALFVIAAIATGQNLDECYIDPRSGDTIRNTGWGKLTNDNEFLTNYRFVRRNSDYAIDLKCHFGKRPSFDVLKGDSVWIKLSNGVTIRMYADSAASSRIGGARKGGATAGAVTQGVHFTCKLTQFQMYLLAANDPEKFRYFMEWGPVDMPVTINPGVYLPEAARQIIARQKRIKVRDQAKQTEPTSTW